MSNNLNLNKNVKQTNKQNFNFYSDLNDLEYEENSKKELKKLNDSWTLWAHLPHDTDWSINSYKKIMTFSSVEESVSLCESLPSKMINNCMLFLMRKGIQPVWEDEKNCNGGCFSYKVNNKYVPEAWKTLYYLMIGETITKNMELLPNINGITISPKKSFCIIKIWTSVCNFQDSNVIEIIPELNLYGCIFKKHI